MTARDDRDIVIEDLAAALVDVEEECRVWREITSESLELLVAMTHFARYEIVRLRAVESRIRSNPERAA